FTRAQQDAYAAESFRRAGSAQAEGRFAEEITPVEVPGSAGSATLFAADEGPQRVNYDKIPTLKPAFEPGGTITPANASSLNDGAAAVVLATTEYAAQRGLQPIARLVAFGSHAQDPLWFTTAPIAAARN